MLVAAVLLQLLGGGFSADAQATALACGGQVRGTLTAQPGANATHTFRGTAGTAVMLTVRSNGPVELRLQDPGGKLLDGPGTTVQATLPADGVYSVVVSYAGSAPVGVGRAATGNSVVQPQLSYRVDETLTIAEAEPSGERAAAVDAEPGGETAAQVHRSPTPGRSGPTDPIVGSSVQPPAITPMKGTIPSVEAGKPAGQVRISPTVGRQITPINQITPTPTRGLPPTATPTRTLPQSTPTATPYKEQFPTATATATTAPREGFPTATATATRSIQSTPTSTQTPGRQVEVTPTATSTPQTDTVGYVVALRCTQPPAGTTPTPTSTTGGGGGGGGGGNKPTPTPATQPVTPQGDIPPGNWVSGVLPGPEWIDAWTYRPPTVMLPNGTPAPTLIQVRASEPVRLRVVAGGQVIYDRWNSMVVGLQPGVGYNIWVGGNYTTVAQNTAAATVKRGSGAEIPPTADELAAAVLPRAQIQYDLRAAPVQGDFIPLTFEDREEGQVVAAGVPVARPQTADVQLVQLTQGPGGVSAQPVNRGALQPDQVATGEIPTPVDVDQWTFDGKSGEFVRFTLDPAKPIVVRIFDPQNLLLTVAEATSVPALTLPKDGTYTVNVLRHPSDQTAGPIAYKVMLSNKPAAEVSAVTIDVDRGAGGIYAPGELMQVKFTAADPQGGAPMPIRVVLVSESGAESELLPEQASTGATVGVPAPTEPGTYFLRIEGTDASGANHRSSTFIVVL